MRLMPRLSRALTPLAASLLVAGAAHAQMLTGWAQMPAATFANGPTSGQFAAPNPYGTNLPPFANRQPVQGFSAVLAGPRKNVYHFLVDNGFGAQANSAIPAACLHVGSKVAQPQRRPRRRRAGGLAVRQ
jgi:hypothetical protein